MVSETVGEIDAGFALITDRETVRPLLQALPQREHTVLDRRFFESFTQSQIAEHLGISQMRVSRILDKILRTLREQLLRAGRHRQRFPAVRHSGGPR